jgi:hypothetical protein
MSKEYPPVRGAEEEVSPSASENEMTNQQEQGGAAERSRHGDAWQTNIRAYVNDDGRGPYLRVSAHDDGGVTLDWFNHHGENTDRITVGREVWKQVVAAALPEKGNHHA